MNKITQRDWIWENQASTHKYKYLELLILFIWNIVSQERKQILACNLPWFFGHSQSISFIHQLFNRQLAELSTILDSFLLV